jgi:carbonic anhydrase/acetyltransferase-like protein (isoleucine patch superfamily)
VQENCVVHAQPDTTANIEENVDIGHGSIIHGPCTIESNVTVGMGAIICDAVRSERGVLLARAPY